MRKNLNKVNLGIHWRCSAASWIFDIFIGLSDIWKRTENPVFTWGYFDKNRHNDLHKLKFGHLTHKTGDDWVSACRNVEVAGEKCVSRGRKTRIECLNNNMKLLGLQPECASFRDMWRGFLSGQTSNPS